MSGRRGQRFRGAPRDAAPRGDPVVAALSAAGVVPAGYLALAALAAARPAFCAAGSGRAAVAASRYAVFLGLPTAAWGAACQVTPAHQLASSGAVVYGARG